MKNSTIKQTYKLSHYLVFTDSVNEKNERIVYNTINGKLIVISELTYACLMENQIDEITPQVFDFLVERGVLVHEEEDELTNVVFDNMKSIAESEVLYEVIMPSGMCQLGCNYCGQVHENKKLSEEEIESIVNRIEGKLRIGGYKKLEIAWFGGEPMLALNQIRSLTKKLLDVTQNHGVIYEAKIVTNGYKLNFDLYRELIEDLYIRKVDITIDGTAEYHDKKRFTKKGLSSFHRIFENLRNITSHADFDDLRCRVVIRCNVDKDNRARWESSPQRAPLEAGARTAWGPRRQHSRSARRIRGKCVYWWWVLTSCGCESCS